MSAVGVGPTQVGRSAPQAPAGRHGAGFRPDVEGLRAIAAGVVVLGHAGVAFLPGGYVGVDVFFVLSGFLITGLLLKEVERSGRVDLKRFYARRARRLLPAAALVVVATVVGAWFLQSPLAGKQAAQDGLWTVFYAFNVKLAADGTDYLNAEEAPSLLQHFWSLAVEEQFYVVWPLLLVAVAGTALGRRAARAGEDARRARPRPVRRGRVATVLLVVVAGSLALSVWQTSVAQSWAYFGLHTRAWELGVGALLAVGLAGVRRVPTWVAVPLGWLGLAAVVVAAVVYTEDTAFPGYAAAVPVLGTAAVVAAGAAAPGRGASRLLAARPLTTVGSMSYGWYLWHWPLLTLLPAALGVPAEGTVLLVAAALGLGLAALSLHLVENPIRFSPSLSAPGDGLALGFAVSSVLVLVAVTAAVAPGAAPKGERVDVASYRTEDASLAPVIQASLEAPAAPQNLTPAVGEAKGDLPASREDGCHADLLDVEPKRPCLYGDTGSDRTVVLFGDSHADQWLPALEPVAAEAGWALAHRTKSACPPATMTVRSGDLGRTYDECDTWREDVLAEIERTRPELVVVGASYGLGDDDPQQWSQAMATTVSRLTAAADRVVLLEDTPVRSSSGPDCVAANLDDVAQCAVDRDAATPHTDVAEAVRTAVAEAGGQVVDPLGWFCADDVCPEVIGNYLVHRDATHATAAYTRFLAPRVGEAVGLVRHDAS
ncbi:acyltransferase family protein [Thalassiella azotivora]